MANIITPVHVLASFSLGLASHLFYFHHGERHMFPFRFIQVYVLLYAVAVYLLVFYSNHPTNLALRSAASLFGIYFAGLYTSLLTYRLFFNPLNKFPGPFLTRITKFDHVIRIRKFDQNLQLQALHQKHGHFVRIGPNDLSVTDPAGVQVVSAPNSKCTKAEWYSQDAPLISMHTTRDRPTHDRRRRVWAPAFSDRALRGYEVRVKGYVDPLVQSIEKQLGQPINVSELFNHYSFDVMGDLAFGKSFDMLKTGEVHWAIKLLNAGMDPVGLGFPPWFFRFVVAIPGAAADYWRFIKFCSDELEDRMKLQGEKKRKLQDAEKGKGSEEKDITHTLIEQFEGLGPEEKKTALPMLQGDSRLIIVAGSDTTAATLSYLFYWLAKYPDVVEKVRTEVGPLLAAEDGDGKTVNHQTIADAEYLNGCIYEALRLNPPVPSGVFRKTPREGVEINGTWVPGETCIQMPGYVMGHDEYSFVDAERFRPERWSRAREDELIKHKDAWNPFSSGPFGCIGKNLALMEVRLVACEVLRRFEVRFAPGEDGSALLRGTADHFTLGLGRLGLVFEKRE